MPLPEWSKENDRKRASSPASKTTTELTELLKKRKVDTTPLGVSPSHRQHQPQQQQEPIDPLTVNVESLTLKELKQLLKKHHNIDFRALVEERGFLEKRDLEELWQKLQAASSTAKTPGGYTNAARGPVHFTHAPAKTPSVSCQARHASTSPLGVSSSRRQQQLQQQQEPIDPSTLNAEQKAAAEYIFSGGNAFLTGAAGVGKSYLLRYIIQGLRDKDKKVVVAAPTGVAATHIGGVTIHSWAGIKTGKGGERVLVPRVLQNESASQRWKSVQVLILDEVSMIDGTLFGALDAIGRKVRGRPNLPFGGIQLVLSGDFFQLPPVSLSTCGFAFESPAWSKASVKLVELRAVVRQSGDNIYINMLNQIRVGNCPSWVTQKLEASHISKKRLPTVDEIVPTKLYCTNRNVDEENNRKLADLPGEEVTFKANDSFKGTYTRKVQGSILSTMEKTVPSLLRFKVGAQVILTRNMPDHKLVNGSRGIVTSFESLSSASGADGIKYPEVHFSNGVKKVIKTEDFFQGGSSGAMVREQLPLKLAWSLTVHKSQGMTIDCAELRLDNAFDYGQAYVALSRITSLEGLWVRGGRITQDVVKAHPKVKAFYQQNGSTLFPAKK